MDIIKVNNLSLTLGKTEILKNINVTFEEGKIHGLIGRNGSGKTMLMKCICGFVKPTSGEAIVSEKVVGKDVDFPKDTGIIIETPGFIPYYSGYKNLKLLAGLNNKIGKEEIYKAMEQVGLDPKLKRHVRKYSLGMRQRLGLAQAIMENPKILILDEATAAMDTETERNIQNSLTELKNGRTTIAIAHRLSTLRDADKLAVIDEGECIEFGTYEELIEKKGAYYKMYKLQEEALRFIGIGEESTDDNDEKEKEQDENR